MPIKQSALMLIALLAGFTKTGYGVSAHARGRARPPGFRLSAMRSNSPDSWFILKSRHQQIQPNRQEWAETSTEKFLSVMVWTTNVTESRSVLAGAERWSCNEIYRVHERVGSQVIYRQNEIMKHFSSLRRFGIYLLGLVDEYWAMRRPWQYGENEPQCGIQCDGDSCSRTDWSSKTETYRFLDNPLAGCWINKSSNLTNSHQLK